MVQDLPDGEILNGLLVTRRLDICTIGGGIRQSVQLSIKPEQLGFLQIYAFFYNNRTLFVFPDKTVFEDAGQALVDRSYPNAGQPNGNSSNIQALLMAADGKVMWKDIVYGQYLAKPVICNPQAATVQVYAALQQLNNTLTQILTQASMIAQITAQPRIKIHSGWTLRAGGDLPPWSLLAGCRLAGLTYPQCKIRGENSPTLNSNQNMTHYLNLISSLIRAVRSDRDVRHQKTLQYFDGSSENVVKVLQSLWKFGRAFNDLKPIKLDRMTVSEKIAAGSGGPGVDRWSQVRDGNNAKVTFRRSYQNISAQLHHEAEKIKNKVLIAAELVIGITDQRKEVTDLLTGHAECTGSASETKTVYCPTPDSDVEQSWSEYELSLTVAMTRRENAAGVSVRCLPIRDGRLFSLAGRHVKINDQYLVDSDKPTELIPARCAVIHIDECERYYQVKVPTGGNSDVYFNKLAGKLCLTKLAGADFTVQWPTGAAHTTNHRDGDMICLDNQPVITIDGKFFNISQAIKHSHQSLKESAEAGRRYPDVEMELGWEEACLAAAVFVVSVVASVAAATGCAARADTARAWCERKLRRDSSGASGSGGGAAVCQCGGGAAAAKQAGGEHSQSVSLGNCGPEQVPLLSASAPPPPPPLPERVSSHRVTLRDTALV